MTEDKISRTDAGDSNDDLAKEIWKKLDLSATESSRAKIIIASSYLDDLLRRLISKRLLLQSTSRDDNLFDANHPLYNLGPKIDLAYRLGLISGELSGMLHMLRRMRDDSAHSHDAISFDDEVLKDRIDNLHKRLKKKFTKDDKTTEEKFKRVFVNCALALIIMIRKIEPLKEAPREGIFDEA